MCFGPVGLPTSSCSKGSQKSYWSLQQTERNSIHHLLEFLHWEAFDSLACWLCLEDAWLLGERVDALPCGSCRLLLELHVEDTTKFELAVLLQLRCCKSKVFCDDSLDDLGLEVSSLSNLQEGSTGSQTRCTCLLHGLHCWCHGCKDSEKD